MHDFTHTPIRSLARCLVPALAAGLLVPAASAGDAEPAADPLCADNGHCLLPRWIPSGLAPNAEFGGDVTIDGDYAAIGAPGADEVHVYRRVGGQWLEHQVLPSPHGPDAEFGSALELRGERLVVGARLDDLAGPDAGAIHIYDRVGADFQLTTTRVSGAPAPFGYYGEAVATDGPWIAVGEPGTPNGGNVHVYYLADDFWAYHAVYDDPSADELGSSVALDGTEMVAGDWSDDTLGANAGAVYYYALSPTSSDAFVTKVFASDPEPGDFFGWSLDLDEERLVVGAHLEDSVATNGGAAYVFRRQELQAFPWVTYAPVEKLMPCQGDASGHFGRDVAIRGGRVAVGARGDENGLTSGGKVYTFRRLDLVGESWIADDQIRTDDGEPGDYFGGRVDIDGDLVLVGAERVDEGALNAGAAYLVSTLRDTWGGGECPCDTLGTLADYGTGKPGSNGIPELSFNQPLVPGESSLLGLTNALVGATPFLIWGLTPAALPFDGGSLLIADPHILFFPTVGVLGQVGMQAKLGSSPAQCGVSVYLQAMFIDPGASGGFSLAQTAGVEATVGF